MAEKLRALCTTFPETSRTHSDLDDAAARIFFGNTEDYVHSSAEPADRYGISVNRENRQYSEAIPNFNRFGPNEQFLVNKILSTPSNMLCVLGGIGVGKSRFTSFFRDVVYPSLMFERVSEVGPSSVIVFMDFLDYGTETFSGKNSDAIQLVFTDIFCDHLESELCQFFSLEQEVCGVWEAIFENERRSRRKNSAFRFISNVLRSKQAETSDLMSDRYEEVLSIRRKLRDDILSHLVHRRHYLAMLARHVKDRMLSSDPNRFLVVIDNLDREPDIVQENVKLVLKTFVRGSQIKTVLLLRQTSFFHHFDDPDIQRVEDYGSEPYDKVPYCGPSPMDIMSARLNAFLSDTSVAAIETISPGDCIKLAEGLRAIQSHLFSNPLFTKMFEALCGRSVRKSLVLAQRLVDNSLYDPIDVANSGELPGISKVLRALMVGTSNTFTWHPQGIVENIFEVHGQPVVGCLIKLRILRILSRRQIGIRLSELLDILAGFGYRIELIHDALDELMLMNKRLVWSDTVRSFVGDDLIRLGSTRLYNTTAGAGYQDTLFCSIEYIQEVMLDTSVDPRDFGFGWNYGVFKDRFELLFKFLSFLLNEDRKEVLEYVSCYGSDDYFNEFGSRRLLSTEILTAAHESVSNIFSSTELGVFQEQHLEAYEERILLAEDFEREYLH